MKRRDFVRSAGLIAMGVASAGFSVAALARVGRPASPTSVAGRRIRRHMVLYSLPYGCHVTRIRGGVTYYYCGGIWYRPAYQGTTVVYIVEEIEPGAETEVEFEE